MAPPRRIRIATLEADTPVPVVLEARGLYGDLFAALMRKAAALNPELSGIRLDFVSYDCVKGELPSRAELGNVDGLLITGSIASAYDNTPWVLNLSSFLRKTYLTFPHIKIFGSCFGHQILCHALFSTRLSPVVSAHPAGWEIGVHPVALSPAFLAQFGPVTTNPDSPSQARLQMVHADHVVLPFSASGHPDADSDSGNLELPEGWISIGSSAHCALQGVYQRGRVLTFQGHAEFDAWVTRETIDAFLRGVWTTEALEEAFVAIGRDGGRDDSLWAAGVMVRFFAEPVVREAVRKGLYSRL